MINFDKEYKKLNEQQRLAVDNIDGPLLVIAGPGTGKTQLLSTRVANILLKSDSQPQNILCLTYTESAAYEMRQRLINIIGQSAYNITINTYHAFGSELIRRFPDYFSQAADMRPVDDLGIHNIILDIIKSLPYSNALKKGDQYIRDVINAVSDYKRALLTPSDIRNIANHNLLFIKSASIHTKRELSSVARIDNKSIACFTKLLAKSSSRSTKQILPGVVSLNQLWQEQLSDVLDQVHELNKTAPITKWKNDWLVRNEKGEFVVNGESAAIKLLALADVYEKYLTELETQGLYDYDDMILRAIDGLETHADLRYTLQEQYMYILLDEFQDTNAAQLKLVKLLTDNPVYEKRPNIMAVGDDDQAIYAFQGANYSHMIAFKDMFIDVQTICLTKNYRSHKDILHVAHNVAEQIEERLHHHLTDVNKLLTAENILLPAKSNVARHEFKSDVAQYAWVTKKITQLIKNGTSPSEISLLAPKHRYLEPIIPYLRRAKIPVRYEKRENVLEDTHILQLIRMSELILHLSKNDFASAGGLWPEVLSYDFWELPTEEIWQLSWQANDRRISFTKLLATHKSTKPIAMYFARVSNQISIETLETMLDYLIGVQAVTIDKNTLYKSPFYEYNFGKKRREADVSAFWNLLSNLTVIRQHLRGHLARGHQPLQLPDLVEFAQSHIDADIKLLNTSPYHESSEAVQVMTAYKAKGMEFEHVFVLACVDEVWGSKAISQSSRLPTPKNLDFVHYQGASNDERLRLFFVAITRAKMGLYLTSYNNNFANRPTTRLKYLNETEDDKGAFSDVLPNANQRVIQTDYEAPEVNELVSYWQTRHLAPKTLTSLKELLMPRLQRYKMAPTHLNSFTDLLYGGPEHFFLNTILRFPSAPTAAGEYGNAIHDTLLWIHTSLIEKGSFPSIQAVLKTFERKLHALDLNDHDTKLLFDKGKTCLSAYYVNKKRTFKATDKHEISFGDQGVFVGEAHISGKIDKLIIDNKNRTITIVDYKTGQSYEKWDNSNPKLHKYKQQLYFYKLLVEGSYQFADYTVTDAYLEFVEPNEKGNIVDLHIKFDPSEMKHLSKLIAVVWQKIKNLDFPDDSNYQNNMKGINQFEDDLINGVA